MIYVTWEPTASDLSEKFSDFLMYNTVASLKESFSLMGRRFIGQPRKLQIANGIARYDREHPLEVLSVSPCLARASKTSTSASTTLTASSTR